MRSRAPRTGVRKTSRRSGIATFALILVAAARVGTAAQPPVAIYGAEIFADGASERVLVFADRPVEARLDRVGPDHLRLWIAGAVLDDSAPRWLAPAAPREVLRVDLSEASGLDTPTVLIEIQGTRAIERAELSREAALLAIEIPLRAAEPGDGIVLSMRATSLPDAVRAVASSTGTRFVFDERLAGRVTLSTPAPVSVAEALGLLDVALALSGFVALPAPDGSRRILPADLAAALAPWKPQDGGEPGELRGEGEHGAGPRAGSLESDREAPVVTLVRLAAARAEEAVAALRPWLGGALAYAHAPGNAVLLAGSEARLHGILALLRALDEAAAETLWVRRVRHRPAGDLAEWLRAGLAAPRGRASSAQVWSDARSNALIVRASHDELGAIQARVARLDRAEAQQGALRVLRVRHAEPRALAERIRALAASGEAAEGATLATRALSVALDAPTHSLLIAADPETHGLVEDLVHELDRPARRIAVEAIVLQVESDASLAIGFDAFLPLVMPKAPGDLVAAMLLDPTGAGLLQPGAGAGPAGAARYTREPLVIPIVDANGNPTEVLVPRESFVVTADGREITSRVLMRPHLVVASGEEQEIFAGDQVPIPVAAKETGNVFEVRQEIERQDVGVRMRVRPTLGAAGLVRLELDLELSHVVAGARVGRNAGPVLRQRRLQSTVHLADGEVAVVGLAREELDQAMQRGTPGLADAPGIGALFRATQERRRTAEVAVAVHVRVLRDDAELAADGIRRRLGVERSLARQGPLGAHGDAGWALLVATHDEAAVAGALADSLAREGLAMRTVAWTWEGLTRFDVYATGFADLPAAAASASRLAARGLNAELVALPVPGA